MWRGKLLHTAHSPPGRPVLAPELAWRALPVLSHPPAPLHAVRLGQTRFLRNDFINYNMVTATREINKYIYIFCYSSNLEMLRAILASGNLYNAFSVQRRPGVELGVASVPAVQAPVSLPSRSI